jgi:hypothetical protein
VIERSATVEAFGPIVVDDRRPDWIGPAAFTVPSTDAGPPVLALYPVCFEPGDLRCRALAGG